MEIKTEQELAERLDFRAPLKPDPEERSMWCVPFEYGGNVKGTRISIAMAKTISAQLRADVAEAEKAELLRYFKREEERAREAGRQTAKYQSELYEAKGQIAILERRLRAKKKKGLRAK